MRLSSLLLVIAGIVLFAWGVTASDSIGPAFAKAFSGPLSDRSLWLIAGGAALVALGAAGSLFSPKG